uniref:Skp1, putative n=1 Tax=Arundo donax TaxID=35708 RepID=A0A0A9B580_ARUDO
MSSRSSTQASSRSSRPPSWTSSWLQTTWASRGCWT